MEKYHVVTQITPMQCKQGLYNPLYPSPFFRTVMH
jgi:hypothetical protein